MHEVQGQESILSLSAEECGLHYFSPPTLPSLPEVIMLPSSPDIISSVSRGSILEIETINFDNKSWEFNCKEMIIFKVPHKHKICIYNLVIH